MFPTIQCYPLLGMTNALEVIFTTESFLTNLIRLLRNTIFDIGLIVQHCTLLKIKTPKVGFVVMQNHWFLKEQFFSFIE